MNALTAGDLCRWFVVLAAFVTACASAAIVAGQSTDDGGAAKSVSAIAAEKQVAPASFTPSPPAGDLRQRQAAFAAGIEAVRRAGILKKALAVGDKAVDFELNDAAGYRIQASELWAMGPLVAVFYRGGWSPVCNAHLMEMQKVLRAIHGEGAQLVAISPETAEEGLATQERNKLTFPVLVDKGNAVARQFGIVYRASERELPLDDVAFDGMEYDAQRGYELPLAATYVIDTGGVIRYAFLEADFSRRAKPQAVLSALRRLQREAPEQRPAPTAPVERTAGR